MLLENKQFVDIILNALKESLGTAKDVDLAKILGVSTARLNNWRSRNSFDYQVIIRYCISNGIDMLQLFDRGVARKIEMVPKSDPILEGIVRLSSENEEILLALSKISTELKLNKAREVAAKITKERAKN